MLFGVYSERCPSLKGFVPAGTCAHPHGTAGRWEGGRKG